MDWLKELLKKGCTPSGVHGLKYRYDGRHLGGARRCTPSGVHGLKFNYMDDPAGVDVVALRLECMD